MGRERAKAAIAYEASSILLLDEDRDRAFALAHEFPPCTVARNLDDLMDHRPGALFICTPPFCRGPLERRAVKSGIPFFVEKPIGVCAAQICDVVEALRQRHIVNAVGYMNRYRYSVAHARTVLQAREIIGIAAHWVGKKYSVPWWTVRQQSGGPFNEQATHFMDLVRYVCGEAEVLHAVANAPEGLETTVAVSFRLASDALGNLLYSCEAKEKDILICIESTDGVIELRGWDLELARNTIDSSYPVPELKPIFEKETRAFLEAARTGDQSLILCDFADAYRTQLAMDTINTLIRSAAVTAPV
jgi:predicted dehydrogenase